MSREGLEKVGAEPKPMTGRLHLPGQEDALVARGCPTLEMTYWCSKDMVSPEALWTRKGSSKVHRQMTGLHFLGDHEHVVCFLGSLGL